VEEPSKSNAVEVAAAQLPVFNGEAFECVVVVCVGAVHIEYGVLGGPNSVDNIKR